MKMIKRRLTEQEISSLIKEIKKTPNILGYTKKEWENFSNILVAEGDKTLAGICAYFDIGKKWSDLAVLYVLPKFRHQGIGRQLLEQAWSELLGRGRNIYIVSGNATVIKWLEEKNVKFVSIFALPWEVNKHNLRYVFSLYRIGEFFRKLLKFPGKPLFLDVVKGISNG